MAVQFLQSMGLRVASEVRDVPINLSYQEAKRFSEIFKTFDKDKDGHISIHDLRKALKEIGENVGDEELQGLIAEVDINKNCTIEEEEFLQVWEEGGEG
jgi:Ca2+-binding EF-hand superfamily protein